MVTNNLPQPPVTRDTIRKRETKNNLLIRFKSSRIQESATESLPISKISQTLSNITTPSQPPNLLYLPSQRRSSKKRRLLRQTPGLKNRMLSTVEITSDPHQIRLRSLQMVTLKSISKLASIICNRDQGQLAKPKSTSKARMILVQSHL